MTKEIKLSSRAIKTRLNRGEVVECLGGATGYERWTRITNTDTSDRKHLWVKEYGGLQAWFVPKGLVARVVMPEGGAK